MGWFHLLGYALGLVRWVGFFEGWLDTGFGALLMFGRVDVSFSLVSWVSVVFVVGSGRLCWGFHMVLRSGWCIVAVVRAWLSGVSVGSRDVLVWCLLLSCVAGMS